MGEALRPPAGHCQIRAAKLPGGRNEDLSVDVRSPSDQIQAVQLEEPLDAENLWLKLERLLRDTPRSSRERVTGESRVETFASALGACLHSRLCPEYVCSAVAWLPPAPGI